MQNLPTELTQILTNKLITLDEVIGLVGIKRSQIYDLIGCGRFPPQVNVPSVTGRRMRIAKGRLCDINTWINDLNHVEIEKK